MSSKKLVCSPSSLLIMGLLVLLALAANHANAITCSQAITTLMPCQPYLVGQASNVTFQCCQGAASLNNMVKSKSELRDLCECLKKTATALHVIVARAQAIPGLCRIQVPVPIDPNVDCSSV